MPDTFDLSIDLRTVCSKELNLKETDRENSLFMRPLFAVAAVGPICLLDGEQISSRSRSGLTTLQLTQASILGLKTTSLEKLAIESDLLNLLLDAAVDGHQIVEGRLDRLVRKWSESLGLIQPSPNNNLLPSTELSRPLSPPKRVDTTEERRLVRNAIKKVLRSPVKRDGFSDVVKLEMEKPIQEEDTDVHATADDPAPHRSAGHASKFASGSTGVRSRDENTGLSGSLFKFRLTKSDKKRKRQVEPDPTDDDDKDDSPAKREKTIHPGEQQTTFVLSTPETIDAAGTPNIRAPNDSTVPNEQMERSPSRDDGTSKQVDVNSSDPISTPSRPLTTSTLESNTGRSLPLALVTSAKPHGDTPHIDTPTPPLLQERLPTSSQDVQTEGGGVSLVDLPPHSHRWTLTMRTSSRPEPSHLSNPSQLMEAVTLNRARRGWMR